MDQQILFLIIGAVALLLSVFLVVKKMQTSLKKQNFIPASEQTPSEIARETSSDTSRETSSDISREISVKQALAKTEENFFGRIRKAFSSADVVANLEQVEEVLYTSDLGPATVQALLSAMQDKLSKSEQKNIDTVKLALKDELTRIFSSTKQPDVKSAIERIELQSSGVTVVMVVGVNGAGKTTSIGKISAQFAAKGKKVLVAAGDTFRAAAGGQLKVWTERAQVEIFSPDGVTDPSAVAFDAVTKAVANSYDVVIIDTAGRLHTQANLMEELKKMKRVMGKVIASAPHEVLIVLDANSGQNALMQAKEFHSALGLTGVVLTKMDGTAKGGVAVGLVNELKVPIKMIGIGEKIDDLRAFSDAEFIDSILG